MGVVWEWGSHYYWGSLEFPLMIATNISGASRSPIYSSFSESLAGLQTIRAWKLQERFRALDFGKADVWFVVAVRNVNIKVTINIKMVGLNRKPMYF